MGRYLFGLLVIVVGCSSASSPSHVDERTASIRSLLRDSPNLSTVQQLSDILPGWSHVERSPLLEADSTAWFWFESGNMTLGTQGRLQDGLALSEVMSEDSSNEIEAHFNLTGKYVIVESWTYLNRQTKPLGRNAAVQQPKTSDLMSIGQRMERLRPGMRLMDVELCLGLSEPSRCEASSSLVPYWAFYYDKGDGLTIMLGAQPVDAESGAGERDEFLLDHSWKYWQTFTVNE